jgi:POT family proton-dependent oligopeptide transporter
MRVRALLFIFAVVALFWMAFKQNGLTLTRWARDHTAPFLGIDFEHNASISLAINPALVILLTPLLVLFWSFLKRAGMEVSTPRKILIGMLLTAACFLVMGVGGLQLDEGDHGRVSVVWLFAGYVLVTLGELCVSPMGLSVVSKLAPPRYAGLLMGGWFVATSLGAYLAGALGAYWKEWTHATFFFVLVGSSLAAALLLQAFMGMLEKAMHATDPAPVTPVPEPESRQPVSTPS